MFRTLSEIVFSVLQDAHQENNDPSAFQLLQKNYENGSASRNCGHDKKGVAGIQRRVETVIAFEQIVVHKKMNVPPHCSGLVADTSINTRMILLQLYQSLPDRRS